MACQPSWASYDASILELSSGERERGRDRVSDNVRTLSHATDKSNYMQLHGHDESVAMSAPGTMATAVSYSEAEH